MKSIILSYLGSLTSFVFLDFLWLGVFAKSFYQKHLGFLMAEKMVWPSVILFYLLYTVGVLYFAVLPAFEKNSWQVAVMNGALFGFFAYMTYELTNHAIIKNWPQMVIPVDIAWGVFVGGMAAVVGFLIMRNLA